MNRLLLAVALAACIACDPGAGPAGPSPEATPSPEAVSDETAWIDVTVGGIPSPYRELLVLPPDEFLVDVSFALPEARDDEAGGRDAPDTISVSLRSWTDGATHRLGPPIARRPDGASFRAAPGTPLAPGSYTIWATVDWPDGASESVSLAVAVRERGAPGPLQGGQWIQLDFDADRDRDGEPDFPIDLLSFGLAGGGSAAVDMRMEARVIDEIVGRTARFYDSNPSLLPGGDPLAIVVSADPPIAGPFTRICVGGASPGEGSIIGNVLLDPGNQDRSDEACDDYLPSGVFPREIHYYADDPLFQEAFGPLQERPPGTRAMDVVLLSPGYEPADDEERRRADELRRGIETFATVVASVTAHEAAHAMGLVPPGAPGEGLFGGRDGADFTHNLTPEGVVPDEPWLMNPGPSLSFADLAGANGSLRLRALNFAYLQGRVLLDARVDGVYPPPRVDSVSPAEISTDEGLLVLLEIEGRHLRESPVVMLRGPDDFFVPHSATVTGRDGGADRIIGNVLAPTLAPGSYDLEITNPDGQSSTLPHALQVR